MAAEAPKAGVEAPKAEGAAEVVDAPKAKLAAPIRILLCPAPMMTTRA